MRFLLTLMLFLYSGVANAENAFAPGAKIAFLGLTFLDTSTEGAYFGARDDEAQRLSLLEELISDRFGSEGMVLLDLAPIAGKLENTTNPANCYGCDVRMAKELDADFVVVGVVQKVSNLIISMNLVMRDVETGKAVRGRSVDVRSNTDQSWTRGMKYILKTTFFKEQR
ncbi:DUF3280 domain-containing protein [Roseibium sp. TrichSKD4]|uniref:DUF3280 domain-containing protein n=1 Tax=Roseibium sp. TrichSKD4 TaxID=744980 RepID=UPI00058D4DDC|nr:DUF3280 domain-containing protein [Roseibium sp. TrichSKD4]